MKKVAIFLLFAFITFDSYAQDDENKRLENLITQAQKEIEAEETAINADKENFSASEKECLIKISFLTSEINTLKKEIDETLQNSRKLNEEIQNLKDSVSAREESAARINQSASEMAEELQKKAPNLPLLKFREFSQSYSGGLKAVGFARIEENFTSALLCINLTEIIALNDGAVTALDGRGKNAKFLTAGAIAQIYLTEDKKETGVLLYSDSGERKYQKGLSGKTIDSIKNILQNPPKGEDVVINVPLDVTQEMIAGTRYGFRDFSDWFLRGGIVMYPIAGVAALALVMLLNRIIVLYREPADVEKLLISARENGKNNVWDIVAQNLKRKHGALSSVVAAGVENRNSTVEKIEEAMRSAGVTELARLERFLPTIAVLATVAPLLGLLGTVTGMIGTFNTIAAYGSSEPRLLSGGISEALITTEAGLIIAIPVMLLHALLSSRVDRITDEMEKSIVIIVNTFSINSNDKNPVEKND